MVSNIKNQKARNDEKWFKSKMYKSDLSGSMGWCLYCGSQTPTHKCNAPQTKRDQECLCAKAYNKMKRSKK